MTSWEKLVTRLATLQCKRYQDSVTLADALIAEAGKLLPYLFMFSEEHQQEGKRLQKEVLRFQDKFTGMVDDIWAETPPQPPPAGGEHATPHNANGVDTGNKVKPPKPLISAQNWTVRFWK